MLSNTDVERHVSELRGFLQALRRLCGNAVHPHVELVEVTGGAEDTFSMYMVRNFPDADVSQTRHVSYLDLKATLHNILYSKLYGLTPEAVSMLDWDLIEYYGLVSVALDPNGPFNPLVENGALLQSITSIDVGKCSYFAVEISGYLMITGFTESMDK